MPVEFLEVAAEEFLEAIAYYNGESEGLGYEFASEVKRTLARIAAYPSAWVSLSNESFSVWCAVSGARRPDSRGRSHAFAPGTTQVAGSFKCGEALKHGPGF